MHSTFFEAPQCGARRPFILGYVHCSDHYQMFTEVIASPKTRSNEAVLLCFRICVVSLC